MYYKNVQNIEQNTFNLRAIFLTLALKPYLLLLMCVYMEKVCIAGEPEPCLKKQTPYVSNCTAGTMVFNFTGLNL